MKIMIINPNSSQDMTDADAIPVLDGVVCATKMAESIIDMGRKTSKYKTYKFPERKAFTGLMQHFGSESKAADVAAE